ncbi:hypothetical protein D9M68_1004110 [compost metagenome]
MGGGCQGRRREEAGGTYPPIPVQGYRQKAASEARDLNDASVLRGHAKEEITERVYRRVGAIAKPSK